MPRRAVLFVVLLLSGLVAIGCESGPKIAREDAFGPAKVRLHPTFTQVKDWSADKKVDGIEAVVELVDSFDEPTRGSGTFLFELSEYDPKVPQAAKRRIGDPWSYKVDTREQQAAHWNAALRAYTFQLPGKPAKGRTYVLDVSFETAGGADKPGGGRLFDRLILEPPPELKTPDKEVKRSSSKRPGSR